MWAGCDGTMTTAVATPADTEHADLALLRGPDRVAMVETALTSSGQWDPSTDTELDVTVDRVHYRPGSGASVGYRLRYLRRGEPMRDYVVASTSRKATDGDGVMVLRDGQRTVRLWRRPFDPTLPSLRPASDPQVVRAWLADAGLVTDPSESIRLQYVAYRPLRRAVLRVTVAGVGAYLKVLPPARAEGLARRHLLLNEAGVPAPPLLATPAPGVCLIGESPGQPLSRAIAMGTTHPQNLPGPAALVAWLDALPPEVMNLTHRPTWTDRLDFHSAAAAGALPQRREEITALGERLQSRLADVHSEFVPTHGDFYEGNVLTSAGHITSVIDLDSLGPGRRSDDLATMLGHVAVLPALSPEAYRDTPAVLRRMQDDFETRVPAEELRLRTAAVILSLVPGTTPEQAQARLQLATRWAQDADRTRRGRRLLRDLSSSAPADLMFAEQTQTITTQTQQKELIDHGAS